MTSLDYIGIKEDGKTFRVINKALLEKELIELPKGKYRLIIEKLRRKKSNSQLAWLFGQVYPIVLKGLVDIGYEDFTTLAQVDELCKSMFAKREIVNRNTGEIITVPSLKRDFSTIEMMTYTDAIRNWAEDYLKVTIPEPEQNYEMNL